MRAPAGYYRQLLPEGFKHIRLAQASQPMSGVRREPCGEVIAAHFDTLADDEWAAWYAARIRNGELVAISVLEGSSERVWRPGELFMRS